jgi:uncharacterized membrane protein YidH (DUF202 family)
MQSNSYCNLGLESGQQTSPTLTRLAEQNDDNAPPDPPQSSFQTVYGFTEAGTNLSFGFPSSWSIPNVSHPRHSLNDVKNSEPYPSSAPSPLVEPQSHTNPPPLADNNFLTSITSKNEDSSSHSNNHVVLSSIFDLKRFNPAIVLQNSGSVARDHLASERTFLAYVHTSLALAIAGIGMVQLFTVADFIISKSSEIPISNRKMKRFAMPLGVLTQVLALYILFLGECEWFTVLFFAPGFVSGEFWGLIPLLVYSFCPFFSCLSLYMTQVDSKIPQRCV